MINSRCLREQALFIFLFNRKDARTRRNLFHAETQSTLRFISSRRKRYDNTVPFRLRVFAVKFPAAKPA